MQATIRDVARRAGVSIATVSRTMREPTIVRPGTRERVLAAAAQLEFEPSQLGRQLAERRHAANGIVFPDLSGPYFAEVVLGYEAVAAELGRSVLILSTHGRDDAESAVRAMARRCDGLVVLGRTVPDRVLEGLVRRGTQLVLIARRPIEGVDSVNAENLTAARELARHVVATGARRLRFVGDPDASPDVAERFRGVREVCAHLPEVTLELDRVDTFDEKTGARLARHAIETYRLPDAFLCANDELALGALGALRAAGTDVPGSVRVTGWDDVMAATYAGLTTVRQPMRALGAAAARQLDELITGRRDDPRHEVLPTALIVRTTTHAGPHRKDTTP